MKDKSSPKHRMLEAIELAGRGRGEPSDPAIARLGEAIAQRADLAEQLARSKRLDEAVRRVMCDVPAPDGLAERIIQRLGQAAVETDDSQRPGAEAVAPLPPPRVARGGGRSTSRRRWMFASAGAAATVVAAAWLCYWTSDRYTASEVLDQAVAGSAGGNPASEPVSREVLDEYPPSRDVRPFRGMRWRRVTGLLGRDAVAYEMATPGGTRATLFVVRYDRAIKGLEAADPGRPQRSTGGRTAGAWQADGMVYVLVVAGGRRDYQSFLQPAKPIA